MADPTLAPLEWALKQLRDAERQGRYAMARAYYDGDHPMMFATDKFMTTFGKTLRTVADNLCPAVVDSLADRLKVTGVEPDETVEGADPELATAAWSIWQRNRMDVRAPETHQEALLTGDGYALVWPNREGEAVIWSIPACDMAVSYDPNRPGLIRRAARVWFDEEDGRVHVDVFDEELVRRYVTRGPRRSSTLSSRTTVREFQAYLSPSDLAGDGTERNEWGRVPVFHFPNRTHHRYGLTELKDVYPLQDALNKTLCDLLVSNEFAAFRQRWATGYDLEAETPPEGQAAGGNVSQYGVDRMLTSSDPATKFGNFDASEARGFLETIENLRSEIARVSGTPLHYLFITRGDFPSGEAMKSAEARFTRKVENRQTAFGNQWEDLLAFALRVEGNEKADGGMLSLEWESAEPTGLHEAPAAGETPNDPADQPGRLAPPAPEPPAPPAA